MAVQVAGFVGERYLGLDFTKRAETSELVDLLEKHVRWEKLFDV